jgi:hypothetical protein
MSVSTPLTVPSIPSFDNDGLDPAQVSLNRLQQMIGFLDNTLRLPSNPRAFMVYIVGLAIVFAGAFMHVLIAAQIMQAEYTLGQLQQEFRAIEQQNGDIIFQIARDTNMARLHERVVTEGYVPVQERDYVYVPSESVADAGILAEDYARSLAASVAQPVVAPTPATLRATQEGGQFARWEEFWNTTWRSATSTGVAAASNTAPSGTGPSTSTEDGLLADQPTTTSDFWSTWWQEATTNGAKLLEQFR